MTPEKEAPAFWFIELQVDRFAVANLLDPRNRKPDDIDTACAGDEAGWAQYLNKISPSSVDAMWADLLTVRGISLRIGAGRGPTILADRFRRDFYKMIPGKVCLPCTFDVMKDYTKPDVRYQANSVPRVIMGDYWEISSGPGNMMTMIDFLNHVWMERPLFSCVVMTGSDDC